MSLQERRRTFLSGIGSAAVLSLAGCSSSGSSGGMRSWQEILDTRTEVQEDGYQTWSWNPEQSLEVRSEFTVRDGPEVEVFLLESTEFDEYQAGNRFYSIESLSGTSDRTTFSVESGNYRLLLDHTSAGNISPPTNFNDDVADVEITVEAR